MKLSTRNWLPDTITEVVKREAATEVTFRVGDNQMVALITRESTDELRLEVTTLVKVTDDMVMADGRVA